MNLLLITFSFPPAGGVGVLRALSFARYLPTLGVRVDVLTAGNAPSVGKDRSLLQQLPPAVTVHRAWTIDLPFGMRKWAKGALSGGASRPPKPDAPTPPSSSLRRMLKQWVGNLLLPDPQVGWLPFATPAAVRIVRRRKIDAVVITVPPFSSVRMVSSLRRQFPRLPIVLDFRDEWLSTTINHVSFNKNERARAVAQKAESEAVHDATAVVAVTQAARAELMGRYPSEDPHKFRYIANGFEPRPSTPSPTANRSHNTVVLTYLGSVYGSTDPAPLVEAVLALPAELRARLRLRFIGHIETPALRESLLRMGETVELQGFIPQAEALKAMDSTDYLLLISHDRLNVSAKFYDYLSADKPIAAILHPQGDVRRLLEQTRSGRWAPDDDPAAIRDMLLALLQKDGAPSFVPDRDEIARYHRSVSAQQLGFAANGDRERVTSNLRPSPDWPPVVVASVFQTGLNLMRDLLRRGVRTVGIDCDQTHEGFRSSYGTSYLCPNPDTHPQLWVDFMIDLARTLGQKPVIIPAADQFVSAIATHAAVLQQHYIFSMESVAVQGALATKEQQYALAPRYGLPIPRSDYIQSRAEMEAFVATARFPCLIKPRHQREWDVLPEGNPLRGLKLITSENATDMLAQYAFTEPYRPEVMAQEIIAGGDDTKYCYLSVYGSGSRRLGHCVVREFRAFPIFFGSGSLVEPVVDPEIDAICDGFLRGINYVGICEIEVKRDERDGVVRLIEANPRFSGTGDSALYTGVEIGWLHYLDLIGQNPAPMEPVRFNFRHVTLRRDIPSLPFYLERGILTWGDIWKSYEGPLEFFDFDLHDLRPTLTTVMGCLRVIVGAVLRWLRLKQPLPKK